MRAASVSPRSSQPSAESGRSQLEAALAAMSPSQRLALFWKAQEIAVARSWALVERSGLMDPAARVRLVIRCRYPDWSDAEVTRLLDAICRREDPTEWLARLRSRAEAIAERLGGSA
jgi:hypothetical protein